MVGVVILTVEVARVGTYACTTSCRAASSLMPVSVMNGTAVSFMLGLAEPYSGSYRLEISQSKIS